MELKMLSSVIFHLINTAKVTILKIEIVSYFSAKLLKSIKER